MSTDKRKRTPDERRAERAAYDERTRRIEEYLARHGIPIGRDRASYDERSRRLQAALDRYVDPELPGRESS